MKKLAIAAAALFSAGALYATELNGISAADIKVPESALPAPAFVQEDGAKCGHYSGEITANMHLYAQASKSRLFTYAKTEAEFKEFVSFWTPIIGKFGIKVVSTEYKADIGYGFLKYESADGRVIRMFNGDGMNYDALSQEAMKKEQHMLLEALEREEMTPVAAFMIKNDVFRPTFNVYYLTQPDENEDHEVQLRQLKNGDDIDFDLLTGKVALVEKDASFSLVYIGRLLGMKSKIAADEAGIAQKLEDYKKFLSENKKEFIASRTFKLDKPFAVGDQTYNYAANIYFFQ